MIKAVCILKNESKSINGIVIFEQTLDNISYTRVYGSLTGVKKGLHGFHIHQYGDTSKGCDSMGPHFNPLNKNHGDINDPVENHVGDLGNIYSQGEEYETTFDLNVNNLNLIGQFSVIGRGLVLHEDADDLGKTNHALSKTTGNSGSRIACGVIGIAASK